MQEVGKWRFIYLELSAGEGSHPAPSAWWGEGGVQSLPAPPSLMGHCGKAVPLLSPYVPSCPCTSGRLWLADPSGAAPYPAGGLQVSRTRQGVFSWILTSVLQEKILLSIVIF